MLRLFQEDSFLEKNVAINQPCFCLSVCRGDYGAGGMGTIKGGLMVSTD